MGQVRVVVGTTPVLLLNSRESRGSLGVSMPPSSIISGNTGVVYVGKGFVPSATAGAPTSGDPLSQGSQFQDVEQFPGDNSVFTGQVWAVSDTAGQVVIVDETFK